jgi:hypothetical protein
VLPRFAKFRPQDSKGAANKSEGLEKLVVEFLPDLQKRAEKWPNFFKDIHLRDKQCCQDYRNFGRRTTAASRPKILQNNSKPPPEKKCWPRKIGGRTPAVFGQKRPKKIFDEKTCNFPIKSQLL